MSSLTADITDTNFLLDDLLHQLALNSDYALLKSIKHAYTDIHTTTQAQQAAIKQTIVQLTSKVAGLEDDIRGAGLPEVKAHREGVQASVKEKEDEVEGLRSEEHRLRTAVEAKEEEGRQLEHRRKEKLKRHTERMQANKKCLRLYSILSAVRFDAVDETQIRGTFHGIDSIQRTFAYTLDSDAPNSTTSVDATNHLWHQLWSPEVDEPFQRGLEGITSAIDRLTFAVE